MKVKEIEMKKPDVKNYDYKPYGYINALQKYIKHLEEKVKNPTPQNK